MTDDPLDIIAQLRPRFADHQGAPLIPVLPNELEAAILVHLRVMPKMLWAPYEAMLNSKIADVNNAGASAFAGSITAALFLKRFVEKTKAWAHFDIFAWNPADRPHGPAGGEAQGIRALEKVISQRFG